MAVKGEDEKDPVDLIDLIRSHEPRNQPIGPLLDEHRRISKHLASLQTKLRSYDLTVQEMTKLVRSLGASEFEIAGCLKRIGKPNVDSGNGDGA